ncbi:MAG: phosphatidylserine decarboxylase [Gammaproteobacteria bacterium]|nr:phosphatidylserine decarboxylase [Gammaproteobacteria bacterium]
MKIIDSHPKLAREGWFYVCLTVFAALLTTWVFGFWVGLLFWVIAIFVLQFFRDPYRAIPQEPGTIVAPADGKVIFTGVVDDPYLDRQAFKISVFMNVFSVHSNRAAESTSVKKIWYSPGLFVNAALDKASQQNERNAVWLQTDQGQDIVSVQVAGLVARRILCYVKEGDILERGQRYGFIRFGSRVDLFLPTDFQVKVALGDNVSAGTSILGHLG